MKSELTRQCEMAWKRGNEIGFAAGLFSGFLSTLGAVVISEIIINLFK